MEIFVRGGLSILCSTVLDSQKLNSFILRANLRIVFHMAKAKQKMQLVRLMKATFNQAKGKATEFILIRTEVLTKETLPTI